MPSSIVIGQAETGITATPTSASAAPVKGSMSIEVTSPSTPRISCLERIEAASFFRGQRTALFNLAVANSAVCMRR